MVTALIIALTATTFLLTVVVLTVLTGWLPRLVALAARGLEMVFPSGQAQRLDPRERAELIARLWVPY